jgi:hypothetical protein
VSDDYLWDRSGPPDPDVARLEQLLGTLRHTPEGEAGQPLPATTFAAAASSASAERFESPASSASTSALAAASEFAASARSARSSWYVVPFAIAASLIAAAGVGSLAISSFAPRASWQVSSLEGAPTIASKGIGEDGHLPVGEWLETDASARARIEVGNIGRVDVDPSSRIGLLSARAGNYRLHLVRGTMHALIWAPPGQFFVETPSSTAVDLGCAYTLTVADDGAGIVEVTSGWVGFEWKGRESFIPSGAVCATRPGIGPGTPHYADASPALQAALTILDFGRAPAQARGEALATVLAEARQVDAVTLWHLLSRVETGDRDRVFDRLAQFVPPPDGVTRDGVRTGRRDMLDRWWDDLGLGSMQLWRGWKQGWRDERDR